MTGHRTNVETRDQTESGFRFGESCIQGATVTALRGRGFAATRARPRKVVTAAPQSTSHEATGQGL